MFPQIFQMTGNVSSFYSAQVYLVNCYSHQKYFCYKNQQPDLFNTFPHVVNTPPPHYSQDT